MFLHRDIKPENVLLSSRDSDTAIKLCDFGFAKHVAIGELGVQGLRGTLSYLAPEVLRDDVYDFRCDIWSLGVLLYTLMGGYSPFYADNQKKQIELIKAAKYDFNPDFWSHISEDGQYVII